MAFEKKQVLYDLRMTYDGPFILEDFYAEVDKWIDEKGYDNLSGRLLVDLNPIYFRPAEVELLWADCSKAENKLGWTRNIDFPDF